jgi:hypothetical protein
MCVGKAKSSILREHRRPERFFLSYLQHNMLEMLAVDKRASLF